MLIVPLLGATDRRLQKCRSGCRSSVSQGPPTVSFSCNNVVFRCRLVFDRDTGKPKGYGFCEFAGTSQTGPFFRIYRPPMLLDHETAASAVRNLNGQEIGGRPLRIDLADSDPFLEGKTTVRGEIIDGGETRAQWRERNDRERHERERHDSRHGRSHDPNAFLQHLPKGVPLAPGTNSLDAISHVLATVDPSQILEVLAQMKVRPSPSACRGID